MQGKQNMTNTERKGPHKSMHCRFCKPRGVVTPEKPIPAQLEAKTNIHLVHEAADLRLCNIHDEPGFPVVESEACVCILEGENPCPKCVPDKNRPPPKKKVCNCPKGAKPHPSMYNVTVPKKKKQKEEDDEFWWEKYSRERDAIAQETWAAYMDHRRKEKKLEKSKSQEQKKLMKELRKNGPKWYQKLSCQQVMYTEFLSTAIRLDADENIVDRTHFVLGGIGIYPRPKKKLLKRCIRYCHYNAVQFLKQLHMLTKDEDLFHEYWQNKPPAENFYTWNNKLIMNCICHLEFPAVLREIMERLPPLPRQNLRPQIPYPEFPKLPVKKYESPYEEPLWQDRLNWSEKMKIDRLNRCRANMENKRIKIPYLALVKRPSLIDARPPFLAQIMANERASRTLRKEEEKKKRRKHPISTFNSAVDVTAIAGIEASDISTTDKADTDDICVFLKNPKEQESVAGEMEEEPDFPFEKEVKFSEEPKPEETEICQIKVYSDFSDNSEEEREAEDIPFRTPQKTESGVTITSLCPPPDTTPGPPATHFDRGKRELDILREEICGFTPFVSSSSHMIMDKITNEKDDVEFKLKSAAEKLKELVEERPKDERSRNKRHKKLRKKEKCKRRRKNKKKKKILKTNKKLAVTGLSDLILHKDDEEQQEKVKLEVEEEEEEEEEDEEKDEMYIIDKIKREKEEGSIRVASEMSDPDPDTDDEWSTRLPCDRDAKKQTEKKKPKTKRKIKRIGKHKKRKSRKKGNNRVIELEEEKGEYMKKKKKVEVIDEKETAADSDSSSKEKKVVTKTEVEEKKEEPVRDVFQGDVNLLVEEILKDLAEEGFVCATYSNISQHPDILQLILHLQGKIVNEKVKQSLKLNMKNLWLTLKGPKKFPVPELNMSKSKQSKLNWNDKKWVSRLAKAKADEFYYKVACSRAEYGTKFYSTLYQTYFGTDRYLQIFYAYMISKFKDAILRGIV